MTLSAAAYNDLLAVVEEWIDQHDVSERDAAEALREIADDYSDVAKNGRLIEMSTNDVPGFDPRNADELHMGCWAEHDDGSLIFVESTESDRVIYSIFDVAKKPPIEYRDAMPETSFKKTFSWGKNGSSKEKWTWHDKTPFPWDRVIKEGFADGERPVSADHVLSAAERVAESLRLRGARLRQDKYRDRVEDVRPGQDVAQVIMDKLSRAFGELMK